MSGIASGHAPFAKRHNSDWDEDWLLKLDQLLAKLPQGGGLNDTGVDEVWTQLSRAEEAEFQKQDFYKTWVQPQGLRDTINTTYLRRDTLTGMLSIPSYTSREPYGEIEGKLTQSLTPHIRRAMLINDMTDKGKMALTLYRQVLDRLSVAVFVVGLGRRVVFTNAAGENLLAAANVLQSVNGMLHGSRFDASYAALDEAIDRALKGDTAIGITGIGVPLLSKDGQRAAAYVLPVAGDDVRGTLGHDHCMVFVASRKEQQPVVIEVLRTLFDLTASEAKVVSLLSLGESPHDIAQMLDISINTVRTHLKHAFAKTQTRDQTSLSGLVNGMMPPVNIG